MSFDFSYTNARGIGPLGAQEESDQAQMGVPDEGGALWLIAVCSETGYLMGLPLRSKNQTSLISHELLAFTQLLGHEKVTYYADNEPATRQVLKLLVQARTAIGLETHMRTTKLYDSAGNSLAENAIQRIRGVAASLMEEVATQTGLRFNAQHPLWSWCCRHSAWVLNRFQATQGTTSYELVYGRPYDGKVCRYGEVVHAYVKPKQGYKADPKWKIGICLGKSETQDCWIIGDGSRVFLSRSIRRVEQSWQSFLSCFKAFSAYSWEYQTNFGGRIVPSKRLTAVVEGPAASLPVEDLEKLAEEDKEAYEVITFARSYAGKIDQRKEDEEEAEKEKTIEEEEKRIREDKKVSFREEDAGLLEVIPIAEGQPLIDEENNQAGPSSGRAPSSPRTTARKQVSMEESSEQDSKKLKPTMEKPVHGLEMVSPDPKRAKPDDVPHVERRVAATQVGGDVFYHNDSIWDEDLISWNVEPEEEEVLPGGEVPKELWSAAPLDRVPPDPPKWVDDLADKVEEERLQRMGVLRAMKGPLMGHKTLTTRFVHDWRAKPRPEDGKKQWLRRSRMVAREYALERNDEVHSPATGGQTLRLLPLIYLMKKKEEEVGGEKYWLGSLDVKDAFLQVDQAAPTQLRTPNGHFEVLKNLPGQRIGAKAWYECITSWLGERGFEFAEENPCLGRHGNDMMLLIHVDDVMFVGKESYVSQVFLPEIQARFEISQQHIEKENDQIQFLRRTYELVNEEENPTLRVYPGKYAEEMVEKYEAVMGRVKTQQLPCGQEMLEPDGTSPLGVELAGLYRSLVGCGIYLSQERMDISFAVKELASSMACPTTGSLKKLAKMIGYLKSTMGQYGVLELEEAGHGLVTRCDTSRWLLETFSDSDWSGSKSHRRSTSAAIHMMNGTVVFSSSRGQKSVSLSSAEAELNALVGAAADGIYLKRCLEFLVGESVTHHCLVDNSAALHLCHRKGPGRLRHIAGKLLWVQDLVAQEELRVKSVGTVHNVSDLGTKPLSKARIQLILYWCKINNKEHQRLGVDEHQRVADGLINKGKINRLAKLLNRILLLEGLEQVAGNVMDESTTCLAVEERSTSSMARWVIGILILMVIFLAGVVYLLWKSLREVKEDLHELRQDCKTDGMMISAIDYEVKESERKQEGVKEAVQTLAEYIQKVHRGLIKIDGFVDDTEMKEEDWQHWDYLQKSNRNANLQKLKAQAKELLIRRCNEEYEDESIDLTAVFPDNVPGEESPDGETALVQLDSGQLVHIAAEYLEMREPESDPEDETVRDARRAEKKRKHDEEIERIKRLKMEDLGDLDLPEGRSGLRAKEHMNQLHDHWVVADRAGDAAGRVLVYRKMEVHQKFLDSAALKF